jgi:hypothetical protein
MTSKKANVSLDLFGNPATDKIFDPSIQGQVDVGGGKLGFGIGEDKGSITFRKQFDEGGRIDFDVGGFGESKVLRQFLEDSIQSGNTMFESIKDLTKQANVDLSEGAVVKVLKAYPNKFFTDVAGTKFPLGYDDKNLSKLKEGMNLLKEWEKNPTPEIWSRFKKLFTG